MKLLLARHLWGVTLPLEIALPRFVVRGYEAIESPLPDDAAAWRKSLIAHGLAYIGMIFTAGATAIEHAESFRTQAKKAIECGARQITAQTGSDTWSVDEAVSFYREITAIEADLPIAVGHETHRGRTFFNPWITRDVLLRCPAIRLCCDFSHWVCVAERLSWNGGDGLILELCASRAIHTHARVGYEQGSQVPDPAAPEYKSHLDAHLRWWKALWSAQQKRGDLISTVTPEFGPPDYLHTLPYTNVPVADLEKVCEWMADRVKQEFSANVV